MSEAVPRGKSRGRVFSACAAGTFVSSAPPARPGPGGPADPGCPAPALYPPSPPPSPDSQLSRACAVSCPGGPHSLSRKTPREPRLAWYPASWGSHPCGEAGCDPRACLHSLWCRERRGIHPGPLPWAGTGCLPIWWIERVGSEGLPKAASCCVRTWLFES